MTPATASAGRFIVTLSLNAGNHDSRVQKISAKYGLDPTSLPSLPGFAADLDATQLAQLRCEPEVTGLEVDGAVPGT